MRYIGLRVGCGYKSPSNSRGDFAAAGRFRSKVLMVAAAVVMTPLLLGLLLPLFHGDKGMETTLRSLGRSAEGCSRPGAGPLSKIIGLAAAMIDADAVAVACFGFHCCPLMRTFRPEATPRPPGESATRSSAAPAMAVEINRLLLRALRMLAPASVVSIPIVSMAEPPVSPPLTSPSITSPSSF